MAYIFWTFYSGILSDIILAFYLASILTSYLASSLASILTFFISGILSDNVFGIYSDILSGISSGTLSGILSDILSGICIWNIFRNSFWHFIWHYIFGVSSWLRSGWERSNPELAVEVRRGTLWSGGCCWGPADDGGGRRRKEEGGLANIKSNNPHLTGGENGQNKHETNRTRRNSSYRSCDKRISM